MSIHVHICTSIYVQKSKCLNRPEVQKSNCPAPYSCPLPAGLQLAASLRHVLGQVAEASHVGLRDVVDAELDAVAVQLGEAES